MYYKRMNDDLTPIRETKDISELIYLLEKGGEYNGFSFWGYHFRETDELNLYVNHEYIKIEEKEFEAIKNFVLNQIESYKVDFIRSIERAISPFDMIDILEKKEYKGNVYNLGYVYHLDKFYFTINGKGIHIPEQNFPALKKFILKKILESNIN